MIKEYTLVKDDKEKKKTYEVVGIVRRYHTMNKTPCYHGWRMLLYKKTQRKAYRCMNCCVEISDNATEMFVNLEILRKRVGKYRWPRGKAVAK